MAFRLRTIDFTADGRKIVRDRDVDKPEITVGRSAECDIHLTDLAVEPNHATIAAKGDGRLAIEATGTLGFGVDGKVVHAADVNPGTGSELRFATYRIAVSLDGDGTPLFTIEQVEAEGEDTELKAGFSLAGLLPGKRITSWVLGVLIVAFFLALPITSNVLRGGDPKAKVVGDSSWSTGKLSLAHHSLEDNCTACHVKPFEAVRDSTCIACHKDVHDHADPARLASARGEGSPGARLLWKVAHTFGKPGPGACSDCHTEHEGKTRMAAPAQQFCADCHAGIEDRLADTALGNAADFGKLHPQFQPAVVKDPFSRKPVRVSLDGNTRENNGLTFPHKLHLDPQGGAARMAVSLGSGSGYGKPLQCSNCHRKTEDGIRFKPIDMERDCESCHSLAYDKVGDTFRRLRHGDVAEMMADLSASDLKQPLVANRRRPGSYGEGGPYRFRFSAPAYNAMLIRQALSRDGVCGECHTPTTKNGMPSVVPVTLVTRYMHHGWFDHKAHAQEKCTSCHLADRSSTSADVLLPGIKDCRTCHLGEDAAKAKVPSSCAMCHSYHPTALAPKGVKPDKS